MYCEALKALQTGGADYPPFVALMANGTSGDVNNINFKNPRKGKPPYEQMAYVAEDLARKVHGALSTLQWKDFAPLDARRKELGVQWRVVEPELLAWAKRTEAEAAPEAQNSLPVIYAGRVQRLAQASGHTKADAQVLRVGDVAIGSSPCETFTETGLEFKQRSPFKHAFMVELANGYFGYLPTPRHFEWGGYETWPGTNVLERNASVKLMDALLEMSTALAPGAAK